MERNINYAYHKALDDFHNARRKADVEEILARLMGKSIDLLSYDEIRAKYKAIPSTIEKLEDIPLDAIIGSVSRYSDFTRSFLPLNESDQHRWARVKLAIEDLEGVPPVQVYRIGEYYFVKDGHHRISVARQIGSSYIQAYVTTVVPEIPFNPQENPDDTILYAERKEFYEKTKINEILPNVDFSVSAPGAYPELIEHINVHQYFMGLDEKREIPYHEAVRHWYENIYLPIYKIIRSRHMLRNFPDRTETDLYLWISKYRAELSEQFGWKIHPNDAASDLITRFSRKPINTLKIFLSKLLNNLLIGEFDQIPEPGEWRREQNINQSPDKLFENILVVITGDRSGWLALDLAIEIARRENAWIGGLHIVPSKDDEKPRTIDKLDKIFTCHCYEADIPGKLVVEHGNITQKIIERSRWADLVVIRLTYLPPLHFLTKLSYGLRKIIIKCKSPLLIVREYPPRLKHILLAYDDSPKSNEALFVSTYLSGKWDAELTVISVTKTKQLAKEKCDKAKEYLKRHNIQANFIEDTGNVANSIMKTVFTNDIDFIVMGGYGSSPLLELFFGSTVDRILTSARQPILICK